MSYGQNMAWGLNATKCLGSATWNGQSNPYLIASGYANNIFKGDPVIINELGYITSLYDSILLPGAPAYATYPILGVFVGCSFVTPTALNPIDPASPGRSFWPAGTNTLNAVPATAYIIDDPNTIYNVQTNATPGITQTMCGATASVAIPNVGGVVSGNTNLGTSLVTLDQSTVATNSATANLAIMRLVAISGNYASTVGLPIGYNNVEVLIQNHRYATRPRNTRS